MTQEQFDTEFDAIHNKAKGMLNKVNAEKEASPFTETLERRRERIVQWLADELDLLFNRAFGENGGGE